MLYCLSQYASNRFKYIIMKHDFTESEKWVCDSCGRNVTSMRMKYWPPDLFLEGGKRYPDYFTIPMPFEDKCGMIVSEKALLAFQKEGVTGFESAPIKINDTDKRGRIIESPDMPKYYYLFVKGTISLDLKAMHYRKKNVCPACGSYTWSRQKIGDAALDYASWDQSDICKLTDYPNTFICTQKVIDVIKKNNLKGFYKNTEQDIFRPLRSEKIC